MGQSGSTAAAEISDWSFVVISALTLPICILLFVCNLFSKSTDPKRWHTLNIIEASELAAVMAVVLPGRKIDELEESQMQEMILKWLFGSGLSMNHEFVLDQDEEGELFVVMSAKKECECCRKEEDGSSKAAFDRSPYGSRLAVFHSEGDGTVTLSVPHQYRERRNSTSASTVHAVHPQRYQRTKSDTQVHRISHLEPPVVQMRNGRLVSVDLDEPPQYKPPPPPISERRGQKISPIRTQPGVVKTLPKPSEKGKEDEKDQGFFRSCYREMGTCCLGLCSNFSL
ncbi:unnamed protein product, partial [Mesorhabditis spiculigera]